MTIGMRSIVLVGLGVVGMLVAAGSALADVSVTLRTRASAATGDGAAVTLGDIAEMDPPTTEEASALGEIVVIPAGNKAQTVSIAQVRQAMTAAKVNWAKTTLRGSNCTLDGPAQAAPRGEKAPATPEKSSRATLSQITPQMVDVGQNGPETVRQAVCARLVDLYSVDATDLRLAFDPADDAFLDQAIWKADVVRRVDVQPMGTGGSARTPVSLAIYEGDRIATTRMIAVQALINRTVVTARAPITRGQTIGEDLVEVGRQWLSPNVRMPLLPEAAIGQTATRGISAGAVLAAADVTAQVVCKRGDIVWVHALSGPMTVKAKCRAQGTARDGELVQLKMDGSDRMFTARMSGPGRAVMIAADASDDDADAKTTKTPRRRSVPAKTSTGD